MFYIAIDFDGTIAEHEFPLIGNPVPEAFYWMKQFQDAGATLILWTVRSDGQINGDVLDDAIEFCSGYGVDFKMVNNNPQKDFNTGPKAYANIYIDDAAFGCPLIYNGRKPYVDWHIVGPAVLDMIPSFDHTDRQQ